MRVPGPRKRHRCSWPRTGPRTQLHGSVRGHVHAADHRTGSLDRDLDTGGPSTTGGRRSPVGVERATSW